VVPLFVGLVNIDIELKDRTLNFATLICRFSEHWHRAEGQNTQLCYPYLQV